MTTQLSYRLRRWRKSSGLSQTQAAVQLGRSARTLQGWERGHSIPRGQALTALLRQIEAQKLTTQNTQQKEAA